MSRLDDLRQLRDDIQAWLPETPIDRRAALVGQYRATLEEIEKIEPAKAEADGIDEIARRRNARRASPAPASGRAKRTS
jgi:hypothetical protein